MGVNRAENTLDNRVKKTLADFERQQREIKSTQPNDGSAIVVESSPLQSFSFSLAPGVVQETDIVLQSATGILMVAEMGFTVYIDVKDAAHIWPTGASTNFANAVVQWYEATDATDDAAGIKRYKVIIQNGNPSLTKTFYLDARFYYPKIATV